MTTGETVEERKARLARAQSRGRLQAQAIEEILAGDGTLVYRWSYRGPYPGYGLGNVRLPLRSWRGLMARLKANGFRCLWCRTSNLYRVEFVEEYAQSNS